MGLPSSSCGTPVGLVQGRTQRKAAWLGAACAWRTSQHVQAWLPPGWLQSRNWLHSRNRLLQVWLLHQPALNKRQRRRCELRPTHQQACLILRKLKTIDHVVVRVCDWPSLPRKQQAGHGSCLHLGSSSSKLLLLDGRRRHHLHLQRKRRRLASRPRVLRHSFKSAAVQHAGGGVTNRQLRGWVALLQPLLLASRVAKWEPSSACCSAASGLPWGSSTVHAAQVHRWHLGASLPRPLDLVAHGPQACLTTSGRLPARPRRVGCSQLPVRLLAARVHDSSCRGLLGSGRGDSPRRVVLRAGA